MAASTLRRDAIAAILLALVLGAAWAWRDLTALQQLRLPDTDDVVRLQQIRDWLGGQAFADLTQHRLAGGLPMHWSRLPDLAPAALILLLTPWFGAHTAEVAMVVIWPPMLFGVALILMARIARLLGGDAIAGTAIVVTAIGYPATTLFMPGRIDHHGLQMVLLLSATLSLLSPARVASGIAAGVLAAASMVIGLETAPFFAVIGGVGVVDWMRSREGAAARMFGLGAGALAGLLLARVAFATSGWSFPACDGFTGEAWRAAMLVAPLPIVLAGIGQILPTLRARAIAAAIVAVLASGAALLVSPGCAHPYAGVDPMLARLWLSQVGEAQPLFSAPPGTALGYVGLMLVGIACAARRVWTTRARGWAVLLALQLTALAITFAEVRGAYAGALLAAPALAAAIAAARARGIGSLVTAWLASAGMLYPLAANAFTPVRQARQTAQGDCASPAMLAAMNAMPRGTVIAPIDAGAALLAATGHQVIAAPYHRNTAGNLAAYRFYLGTAAEATAVAARWHANYALSCAAMPGPARAQGLPRWELARTLPDGARIWSPARLSHAPAER